MKRKYKAKKAMANGIKFDSKLEADYYTYLLQQGLKDGIDFKRQVKFVIFDEQKRPFMHKKPIRRTYIADFVFYKHGKAIKIEDTKGYKILPIASFKMDMTSVQYNLPVYIVRRKRGRFYKELR